MDMNGKELIKLLEKNGWVEVRNEGSHHIMKKDSQTVSVPVHGSKSIKKGLLNRIMKDTGMK